MQVAERAGDMRILLVRPEIQSLRSLPFQQRELEVVSEEEELVRSRIGHAGWDVALLVYVQAAVFHVVFAWLLLVAVALRGVGLCQWSFAENGLRRNVNTSVMMKPFRPNRRFSH